MALVKVKPTSPGRRALVKVVNPDLHKGKPHAPLLESQSKRAGRNNSGHITMRHQGGGHKQQYRIVDFKRAKDGISAKVERLEYDPNRSANLALLCYTDGERRYIIAPKGVAVGTLLMSGSEAPIKPGNTLPLRNIPVGTTVHCVEMLPGKGAQIARAAGTSVQLLAREGRNFGQGRTPGIRPQPQRQPVSAVLYGRRAPLHHRTEGCRGGHAAHVGFGSADQAGQYPAAAQYSGRHHRALRRDAAR